MSTEPRPTSPEDAVNRALRVVNQGGQYWLGTGDYRPRTLGGILNDVPWTPTPAGGVGSDCAGFAICWCYKLQRHRPGFNRTAWASVEDDINVNSALEDADPEHGQQDLFELVTTPATGVLVCYPTFTIVGPDGQPHAFIGHVGIVTSVSRCSAWDAEHPPYHLLDIAQCKGPNGRTPGVIATDGSLWEHHDTVWPKPEHRTRMIRALP